MQDNGQEGLLADVLAEIEARDKRDTERAQAPLKPAKDAIHVDCTSMSIEEVIETIVDHGRSAS
jgi:cytidylate kinase